MHAHTHFLLVVFLWRTPNGTQREGKKIHGPPEIKTKIERQERREK